jgi:predicted oxidoreductase
MTREEAVSKLVSIAWATYKPGKITTIGEQWSREDIFTGVHITCTREEWKEIVEALGGE